MNIILGGFVGILGGILGFCIVAIPVFFVSAIVNLIKKNENEKKCCVYVQHGEKRGWVKSFNKDNPELTTDMFEGLVAPLDEMKEGLTYLYRHGWVIRVTAGRVPYKKWLLYDMNADRDNT